LEYRISELSSCAYFEKQLSQWHQRHWGQLQQNNPLDNRLESYLLNDELPFMFVAHGTELMGSAALVLQHKNAEDIDLLWLTNLYVHPPYRDQGIGRALVNFVVNRAKRLGYPEIYLSTYQQKAYYSKLGWSVLLSRKIGEEKLVVMKHSL